MIISKYLIINHRGNVTIREKNPRLAGNEIALKIELEVPNKLFERPVLIASLKVPDAAVPSTKITPKITENVEKLIKEATGLEMRITVVEAVQEEEKHA